MHLYWLQQFSHSALIWLYLVNWFSWKKTGFTLFFVIFVCFCWLFCLWKRILFILWEHSLICFVPFQSRNCSLHLSQEFTRLYPGSQAQPIMSRESAPGLILASGTVGSSLKNQQDMFVSRDGGFTWYQVSPQCSQLFPDSNPGNMLGPVYNPFGCGQRAARIGPDHICAWSNFLHLIQFVFSKEGMGHIVQNRPRSSLGGLVRVWLNTSGLEASRCAWIIGPSFWQDATGPLPVSHF